MILIPAPIRPLPKGVTISVALISSLLVFSTAQAQQFDAWAEKVAIERMRADPTAATIRQYFPEKEQALLDGKLTPNTKDYRASRIASAQAALHDLHGFKRKQWSAEEKTSAAVVAWALQVQIDAAPFVDFEFPFNQFTGVHVNLVNFLSQRHPIRNKQDIENYFLRLEQTAAQIDNAIMQAKEAATRGFLMPTFITNSSLGQFERFLSSAPAKNVLVVSLDERISLLKDISAEERAAYVARAEAITGKSIIPAFQRAQALLQEQLPLTNNDAGLWRLPNGDKAYAFQLRRNTTTHYTPQQIHEIGLKEVSRIEKEMDALLRQLGYDKDSIKERMERLNLDLQPKEADPRAAILAKYESYLRDAEQRAKLIFDITPKASVIVKREPPFTEKTAAAHYSAPTKDGSQPGIFWAPLPGAPFRITGMRTLTYHEGVPGHHFQRAIQLETQQLPDYRRHSAFLGGPAYSEGWALYSEQLASENNWYEGDIVGKLGQLDAELFRSRRLVVDTGLHAMKWTRQQAIDYGIPATEVERYVVMPGQACAYKIGMLKILELRAKAQKAMGKKFSIRQFHNVVLQTGDVPLAVLEQVINTWISSVNSRK